MQRSREVEEQRSRSNLFVCNLNTMHVWDDILKKRVDHFSEECGKQ